MQEQEEGVRSLKLLIRQDEAQLREAATVREEAEASQKEAQAKTEMFRKHVLGVEQVSLRKMADELIAMQQRLAELHTEVSEYRSLRARTQQPP